MVDLRRLPAGRRLRTGARRPRVRPAGHGPGVRATRSTPASARTCVTIDPAGHDYLRRMLPDRSYVVIDDVDALPRELAKLYGSVASRSSRGW